MISRNLLLIMPAMQSGGAEKQFGYLRRELIKRGITVCTILTKDQYFDEKHMIYGTVDTFFIKKEIELIKKIIILNKKHSFHAVIVYDVYGHYLIPAIKMLKIKVLFSERNSGKHRNFFGRKFINMADIITANSKYAVNEMRKYIDKEITYVPNGIKLSSNNNDVRFIFEEKLRICIPARIASVKNQLFIVKAIQMIENAELHLAGKIVEKDYFLAIQNEIRKRRIENKVFYDGYVNDIEKYCSAFDLIVLPSLSEGTANVILEAYAMKKICLFSDIDMNRQVSISDELLFKTNDVEDFVKKIKNLLNKSNEEILSIVNRGYDYVKKNYSIKRMVDIYEKLLFK